MAHMDGTLLPIRNVHYKKCQHQILFLGKYIWYYGACIKHLKLLMEEDRKRKQTEAKLLQRTWSSLLLSIKRPSSLYECNQKSVNTINILTVVKEHLD